MCWGLFFLIHKIVPIFKNTLKNPKKGGITNTQKQMFLVVKCQEFRLLV